MRFLDEFLKLQDPIKIALVIIINYHTQDK